MKSASKNVFAIGLSGAILAACLAGCGASSTTASSTATASDATQATAASSDATTITIWDWDTTFTDHMTEYYKQQNPDKNVNFNILSVASTDYFEKLQGCLSSGEGVPDIILCEMGYRGKVFDLGILDDLSKAPYNVGSSDMFDFANELGSGSNGTLYGVEQQICPSGLAYRRDLCKEYFGTDDPDELESILTDWDAFIAKGKEVQEKSNGSVYMMPGIASCAFYTLRYQTPMDYITDSSIDLTTRYSGCLDTLTAMQNANIIMPGDTTSTIAEGFANKSFIFYPCAPWVCKWTIAQNDPDGSGNWGLMACPGGGFTFGGTSVCVYKDSKCKDAAWDYIKYTYCDGAGTKEAYDQYGFMSGFQDMYGDNSIYYDTGAYNEFFGGQNLGKKFADLISGMHGQVQTTNEANVGTAIGVVLAEYENDPTMTSEALLARLKEETSTLCPSVEVK